MLLLSDLCVSNSTSALLPIAEDVTGNPATQAYTVQDKEIIVLSQLGRFAICFTLGKGHWVKGMQQNII